jgi:glycosyltransferase involved in cell wall biosynthesis
MTSSLRQPTGSVIIPAHDEEAVIERCLTALLRDAEPEEFEVIVATNGCSDRTAEIARAVAPDCTVLELSAASKIAALNAGDDAASCFPRAYLDADVELDTASLRRVIEAMKPGTVLCAAPEMRLDLEGRPWFVRRFFRAFGALPYLSDALVGNGLYVLSERGRSRFDRFPSITADDLFIRNLFVGDERAAVRGSQFVVHPPKTLAGLLAIRERTYRGNAEYRSQGYLSAAGRTDDPRRLIAVGRRQPLDVAVFLAVNIAAKARLRMRRTPVRWERDDSARS